MREIKMIYYSHLFVGGSRSMEVVHFHTYSWADLEVWKWCISIPPNFSVTILLSKFENFMKIQLFVLLFVIKFFDLMVIDRSRWQIFYEKFSRKKSIVLKISEYTSANEELCEFSRTKILMKFFLCKKFLRNQLIS